MLNGQAKYKVGTTDTVCRHGLIELPASLFFSGVDLCLYPPVRASETSSYIGQEFKGQTESVITYLQKGATSLQGTKCSEGVHYPLCHYGG